MASLTYHIDSLYRLAFPDLASKVLTRLDGARDVALRKLDEKVLGNGFQVGADVNRPEPKLNFSGIKAVHLVQGEEFSDYGTPIFQPVTFLGGVYQVLGTGAEQGQVVDDNYVGWRLPATTLAEFKRSKEITKSRPSTANGTTKESVSLSDWNITIRGLILDSQPNYFPEGQLRQLLRWERVADSIDVAGDMFTYLGIRRLVIEDLSIGRVAGSPNVIPFQMQCVSDNDKEQDIDWNSLQTGTPSHSPTPGHVRVVATGSATPRH
jgi:hypothetical protein